MEGKLLLLRSARVTLKGVLGVLVATFASGCRCDEEKPAPGPGLTNTPQQDDGSPSLTAREKPGLPLSGGALSLTKTAIFVADEDHGVLRKVALPLSERSVQTELKIPGRPAQLIVFDGTLAVTVRSPAELRLYDIRDDGLRLTQATSLADDAWGLALSPDRKTAYVTSAWTSRVSAVDLTANEVRWSLKVKREPRGIAVHPDGKTIFVTHLTSQFVTKLVDEGEKPKETIIELPAAPLRSPESTKLTSSLGYAVVLSPDGKKLFAPRHALGALGKNAWFGAFSLDVLSTETSAPLTPVRARGDFGAKSAIVSTLNSGKDIEFLSHSLTPLTQPRAAVFRRKANSLLVLGEGDDRLVEFAADAVDPTLAVLQKIELGRERHEIFDTASTCGAPTGLGLSEDEDTAFVYCRATDDVVQVSLTDHVAPYVARLELVPPPEDKNARTGKSLFLNATDRITSGGLACAGCHPEGRDDGHVWHEARFLTADGWRVNFVGHESNIPSTAHTKGFPRRTPMLAGRLKTKGPFGWHGESETLPDREVAGFGLHRWGGMLEVPDVTLRSRALFLAQYLRNELIVPAPQREAKLTEQQERGEELFVSAASECSTCHVPETNYTNQKPFPLPALPTRKNFDQEKNTAFKTPSLRGLVGRAPYFHDGSASSLYSLIETNHDRMGKTSHLSRADRDALIAFLETL